MALLLDDLSSHGVDCAPHVAARLVRECGAERSTILEVAERLTRDQRSGARSLPAVLPAGPSVREAYERSEFEERDRALLLALSLRLDDRLAPLLDFDGRSAVELVSAPIGRHLSIRAGRVRFVDARLTAWIRSTATAAEIAAVHLRLGEICAARGDRLGADWHRTRGSLEGDGEAARELVSIAGALLASGECERALLLAEEAVQHVSGDDADEARLVAGAAAVGAGFAGDAAMLLGRLHPHASEAKRLRSLGGLFVAQAFLHGAVPEADPGLLRPSTASPQDWRSWAEAASVAALLCAERGDRRRMRAWLEAAREAAGVLGAGSELRDPVVALCWLIAGEEDDLDATGTGPVCGALLSALRMAKEGGVDIALRVLANTDWAVCVESDPLVHGLEHSPLIRAYLAVAEVLLLVWRGDIGPARERLVHAAMRLPVAMPFAGLGVVLARRLDLAVLGEIGPFSRALTASMPTGWGVYVIVDHGIESFLAGAFDAAAASVRLWVDAGAPQPRLSVPGLDEVALTARRAPFAAGLIRPPEMALAQELRMRIAATAERSWRSEREDVHELARTLQSPFARARVETMLGIQHAIRDDAAPARVHFQYAERLFEAAGATAWARAVRRRLDRLGATAADRTSVEIFGQCRAAWAQQLTARELEVAMLAAQGAANRDIAGALNVSVRTVEVHLGRAFTKLDVRNRIELTMLAHRAERHL